MADKKPVARILDPVLDAKDVVWLGTEPGTIRKVYRIMSTPYFNVGMAMFTPGEGGSVHVHDNAEEFSYSVTGGSTSETEGNVVIGEQCAGTIKWNPAGSFHGGKTTSEAGVSMKLFAYSAGGELPSNDGVRKGEEKK